VKPLSRAGLTRSHFPGVTKGEPSAIGPGKDSTVCVFTDADVTYK
jgi:hypothetical protein